LVVRKVITARYLRLDRAGCGARDLVGLFIPMNRGTPQGDALVVRHSVAILPNVAGQVTTWT
jgi:hypothetical protein